MKLAHPYHAYSLLWRALSGKHAAPQKAAQVRTGARGGQRTAHCVVM